MFLRESDKNKSKYVSVYRHAVVVTNEGVRFMSRQMNVIDCDDGYLDKVFISPIPKKKVEYVKADKLACIYTDDSAAPHAELLQCLKEGLLAEKELALQEFDKMLEFVEVAK